MEKEITMIEIRRKRISVTQGGFDVYLKGKLIRSFGDTIELKSNQESGDGAVSIAGWIGRTDTEILINLGFDCMTYEYGDATWAKKMEENQVLQEYRRNKKSQECSNEC